MQSSLIKNSKDIELSHMTLNLKMLLLPMKARSIKNISFTIPENTTTAIVGPSGSGKSTICSLIAEIL